jgi:hypothetical protein
MLVASDRWLPDAHDLRHAAGVPRRAIVVIKYIGGRACSRDAPPTAPVDGPPLDSTRDGRWVVELRRIDGATTHRWNVVRAAAVDRATISLDSGYLTAAGWMHD